MSKHLASIAVSASLVVSPLAHSGQCVDFAGTLTQAAPDLSCTIIGMAGVSQNFPDVSFLGTNSGLPIPTCLSGQFQATLSVPDTSLSLPVQGNFRSGLTNNDLAAFLPNSLTPQGATAATILTIKTLSNKTLAQVFTKDHIVFSTGITTEEELTTVGGTLGARGTLTVHGDTLAFALGNPDAPEVAGRLCFLNRLW